MAINWDAPIEIRDGRNGNWFWVDKEVWANENLTSSDKVVYGSLAFFANQKSQQSFPQMKSLEGHCKLSRRQIYRSIKVLENFKYIHIKRQHGKPNLYTLVDNWKKLQGNDKLSLVTNNTTTSDSQSLPLVTNNTTNKNIYNNNIITRVIADKPRSSSNGIKHYERLPLEKQTQLHRICYFLEDILNTQIVNWGKQGKALTMMLKAGYTEKQILYSIKVMAEDDFYQDKGFDLMTVANNIDKIKAQARKAHHVL